MPRITERDLAARDPEAAALSAMIRAGHRDADLVEAVATACSTLGVERGMLVYDVLITALTADAASRLEALMQKQPYQWQSEFAIRHRAEGRVEGLRDALLVFLERRGLVVAEVERARIEACADADQLARWIERAASATAAADLFVGA